MFFKKLIMVVLLVLVADSSDVGAMENTFYHGMKQILIKSGYSDMDMSPYKNVSTRMTRSLVEIIEELEERTKKDGKKPLGAILFCDSSGSFGFLPKIVTHISGVEVLVFGCREWGITEETVTALRKVSSLYLKDRGVIIFSFSDWTQEKIKWSFKQPEERYGKYLQKIIKGDVESKLSFSFLSRIKLPRIPFFIPRGDYKYLYFDDGSKIVSLPGGKMTSVAKPVLMPEGFKKRVNIKNVKKAAKSVRKILEPFKKIFLINAFGVEPTGHYKTRMQNIRLFSEEYGTFCRVEEMSKLLYKRFGEVMICDNHYLGLGSVYYSIIVAELIKSSFLRLPLKPNTLK